MRIVFDLESAGKEVERMFSNTADTGSTEFVLGGKWPVISFKTEAGVLLQTLVRPAKVTIIYNYLHEQEIKEFESRYKVIFRHFGEPGTSQSPSLFIIYLNNSKYKTPLFPGIDHKEVPSYADHIGCPTTYHFPDTYDHTKINLAVIGGYVYFLPMPITYKTITAKEELFFNNLQVNPPKLAKKATQILAGRDCFVCRKKCEVAAVCCRSLELICIKCCISHPKQTKNVVQLPEDQINLTDSTTIFKVVEFGIDPKTGKKYIILFNHLIGANCLITEFVVLHTCLEFSHIAGDKIIYYTDITARFIGTNATIATAATAATAAT